MFFFFGFFSCRFVDENVEDEEGPPSISGFAVQIREGASKSARPGHRSSQGGGTSASLDDEGAVSMDTTQQSYAQGEGIMQNPIEEVDEGEDVGPLIPPPPSFRGAVSRGGAKQLAQSIPQVNKFFKLLQLS